MTRRPLPRWAAVLPLAVLAACGTSQASTPHPVASTAAAPPAAGPAAAAAAVPTALTTAESQAAAGVSPLTGKPAKPGLPVVVVKIDNVAGAFPQAGLNDSDIVYVEEVEGGLTRLTTIFSSHPPALIGPVRSARTDNIQLLKMYGRPAIAYSGANSLVLAAVRASVLKSADFDALPGPYSRRSDHVAPHNLFLTDVPALVKARKPEGAKFVDLGWSAAPPLGGAPAQHLTVAYDHATLQFDYDPASHQWAISQDGSPKVLIDGKRATASNVIVEEVIQRRDINGHITPFNETIGGGRSQVLRDGKDYAGAWRRHTEAAGTHFRDASGADIPLRPGNTWVLLVPHGNAVTASS